MKKQRNPKQTTWFYWETKNGKRTGKLLKTNNIKTAGKCIIIPPDKDLIPLLIENCLYFSVEYDEHKYTVTISYYWPSWKSLSEKHSNFITELNKVKVENKSMICDIKNLTTSKVSSTSENIESSFNFNLPEQVIRFAIEEIRNMQEVCFGSRPYSFATKCYGHKYFRLVKDVSVILQYRKNCYNEDLIKACVAYPSAPYLYYYLKHCSSMNYPRLDLLTNCEFCTDEDAKDFFDFYNIKYTRRFIRKTSTLWENMEDLLFLMDCNFSTKNVIYYLLKNRHLYHSFMNQEGSLLLQDCIKRKGDRKTLWCLKQINRMYMTIPQDMWEPTMNEILK